MINENFAIVGAVIFFLGSIPYFIDTIKGKIKPNRVTWFLWSLVPFIAFAAQIKQGVGLQSLLTFSVGFVAAAIFIASFINKKAYWKITRLDIACGLLATGGVILWQITKVGDIAIACSIIADGLATFPTIVKSYLKPETENYSIYLVNLISAVITLLTIKVWTFAQFGFPLYVTIYTSILIIFIKFKIRERFRQEPGVG